MSTPRERLLEAFNRVDTAVAPKEVGLTSSPQDRLLSAFEQGEDFVGFKREFADVGVFRAFTGGVTEGFLEPLTVFGREGEGLHLDEASEKIANALGTFVGLGIGFIPIAAGTGLVLKGIGVAKALRGIGVVATETGERAVLYNFVRNTLAGGVQIGGISEELKDVPGNVAFGLAIGGAVEGVFLARALRGNRGFKNPKKLFDDGSPVPDVPVDVDQLAKGAELSPGLNKSAREMEDILPQLLTGEGGLDYDQLLLAVAKDHTEFIRLPGMSLDNAKNAITAARKSMPGARVFLRSTQKGKFNEVLVHNPLDPTDHLSARQVEQWKAIGFYDGQPVIYSGEVHSATGIATKAADRVQIRTLRGRVAVLEPGAAEVARPLAFNSFSTSAARNTTLTKAAESAKTKIGFVIPSSGRTAGLLRAKRGFVDTTGFEQVRSFEEFTSRYSAELAQIQAPSPEEAILLLAQRKGIKGVVIRNEGVIENVHVFEQSVVSYVREPPRVVAGQRVTKPRPVGVPPVERRALDTRAEVDRLIKESDSPEELIRRLRLTGEQTGFEAAVVPEVASEIPSVGLHLDNAVTTTTPEGRTVLQSFTPSWKNSIVPALRAEGVPEKEIQSFLDAQFARMTREMESSLDSEFLAIKNASEIQFGGCP